MINMILKRSFQICRYTSFKGRPKKEYLKLISIVLKQGFWIENEKLYRWPTNYIYVALLFQKQLIQSYVEISK